MFKLNKALLFFFLIAVAISSLCLIYSNSYYHSKKNSQSEDEEEGGIPLCDRMDLAMKQEFEMTKDPATNTVPRERLSAAKAYIESLRNQSADAKIAGTIPGITWQERGPNNCGGRTRAIMIDPNDATKKTVWAAGVAGGIWKTNDITQTYPAWTSANDFFPI